MKKRIIIIVSILVLTFQLQGSIFESDDTRDILPHVDKDTLVIFDLDDTVFRTASILGNDAWFQYQVNQRKKKGYSYNQSTEDVLPLYIIIQLFSQMECIDKNTIMLIADLQCQAISVMALTTRSIPFCEITKKILKNMDIYFSVSSPCDHDMDLGVTHAAKYSEGILFGANNDKGKIMLQFFERTGYWPKKIIFLDDKQSHLEPVKKIAEQRGIPFIGLRYCAEDKRKKEFDPVVADQLLNEFKMKLGLAPLKKENDDKTRNNRNSAS